MVRAMTEADESSDEAVRGRISKDIALFQKNIDVQGAAIKDVRLAKIAELSKMYASDATSYLQKDDLYTAFSCISYAHGLLDAVLELNRG